MPNQPREGASIRKFRCDDTLWQRAGEAAEREGTTRSHVLVEALRALVARSGE